MFNRRLLPDPEQFGSSRLNLAMPDATRSSRNSLLPDEYATQGSRSPRGSLLPDMGLVRSPRNSLVPEMSRSPRHSLVPDSQSLSPRNSLVPLDVAYNRSPRGSIAPQSAAAVAAAISSRSPRHSLVPDSSSRSPRGSLANIDFERSPRQSICPELQAHGTRSPRGSISPMDIKVCSRYRCIITLSYTFIWFGPVTIGWNRTRFNVRSLGVIVSIRAI